MQTVCSFRKFLSITHATASGSMGVGFWSWIVVEAKVYQCEIVKRGESSSRARRESLLRSSGRQVLYFHVLSFLKYYRPGFSIRWFDIKSSLN